MNTAELSNQVKLALEDLLPAAGLQPGELFVVGCSTSEIGGMLIGTGSSEEIARAVMDAIFPAIQAQGAFLAVQCCEHLNRALVVQRAAMRCHDLTEVWVRPWLRAGGAMAMQAMERLADPVMVEDLRGRAAAGIDIGGTFIGMHLRPVVVPIHTAHRHVGEATLMMARTRPKYVGGPRAQYAAVETEH